MKVIIKQKHYPAISADNIEKDILELWQFGKDEANVIHLEREKITELIEYLKKELDNGVK